MTLAEEAGLTDGQTLVNHTSREEGFMANVDVDDYDIADKNGKISRAENEAAAEMKFTKADANQDGILKKGEMKANKKISIFDENGDQELTKDEMMKGARAMFDTWDNKPKDGQVDMAELKEAYSRKM